MGGFHLSVRWTAALIWARGNDDDFSWRSGGSPWLHSTDGHFFKVNNMLLRIRHNMIINIFNYNNIIFNIHFMTIINKNSVFDTCVRHCKNNSWAIIDNDKKGCHYKFYQKYNLEVWSWVTLTCVFMTTLWYREENPQKTWFTHTISSLLRW